MTQINYEFSMRSSLVKIKFCRTCYLIQTARYIFKQVKFFDQRDVPIALCVITVWKNSIIIVPGQDVVLESEIICIINLKQIFKLNSYFYVYVLSLSIFNITTMFTSILQINNEIITLQDQNLEVKFLYSKLMY